jgi:hypothetical protein
MSIPISGLKCEFTGSLNGNNYKLKNLNLNGSGIFNTVKDSAHISNLVIESPTLTLNELDEVGGIISNTFMGGYSDAEAEGDENTKVNNKLKSYISNVQIYNAKITADNKFKGIIGGIVGSASLFATIEQCALYDAEIVAKQALNIGGIAGETATSITINACAFTGLIDGGEDVGGIVSLVSGDDKITNCHTDARLTGNKTIGGIVGTSARAFIGNCFAEGEITHTGIKEARIGGIAGQINYIYGDTMDIILNNNIVDIATINVSENVNEQFVHRIVGHSSCDDFEYDWDNITDYQSDKSTWPRIYQSPDQCFRNNYVISQLAAFDENIAVVDSTTEGETLAREVITSEWLVKHNFIIGETTKAPWALDFENGLYLWFEQELSTTNIDNIDHNNNIIMFDGQTICAEGHIRLYNINGMLLIENDNYINTTSLNAGVYIVVVANENVCSSTKILIQ